MNILKKLILAVYIALCIPNISFAQMSQVKSVPGYYNIQFGDYIVTTLFEGVNYLNPLMFKNISEDEKNKILEKYSLLDKKGVRISLNVFVVDDGKSLTLIDTGADGKFSPSGESAMKNFELAGYKTDDVKTILLTHLHSDHIGGLAINGKARFANATVYVSKKEYDYWLNPATIQTIPEDKKEKFLNYVKQIKLAFEPYEKKQALKIFENEKTIQGFEVINVQGHTPGQIAYKLTSGGKSIVFTGDITHSHSLQFDAPKTVIDFDVDSKQAIKARLKMFEELSKTQDLVAIPHVPFPGIGHIYRVSDEQYQWIPIYFDNNLGK